MNETGTRTRTARAPRAARGETVVLKVGGALVLDPLDLRRLSTYVRAETAQGARIVVVHGGGPEIAELHERVGVPYTKRRGLRVTSEESMPLVVMVLRGLVNTRLVACFTADDIPAIGLSGIDLGLMRTELLNPSELGRVGGPPAVSAPRLRALLDGGLTPVLAPVCLGPDGDPVNVNADAVANAVAVALGVDRLEFACDVPGVRVGGAVQDRLCARDVGRLLGGRDVNGGMIPKLQAAAAATTSGVSRVRIGDLHALSQGHATEVHA